MNKYVPYVVIASVVSFLTFLVVGSYLINRTTLTTYVICERLGTGTVEEVLEHIPELYNAGIEVVVVKLRKNSTTQEQEWRVMVPVAMAFASGDEVELCSYFHRPHTQAAHFVPVITRQLPPTK